MSLVVLYKEMPQFSGRDASIALAAWSEWVNFVYSFGLREFDVYDFLLEGNFVNDQMRFCRGEGSLEEIAPHLAGLSHDFMVMIESWVAA